MEVLCNTNGGKEMNDDLHSNDKENIIKLGKLLRARREALGLSLREAARRADVDKGTISHIEQGHIRNPGADVLMAIAQVLRIPMSDLLAVAGWMPKNELPTLTPYLRTKYNLTPEETRELEEEFARIAREKGISFNEYEGP